MMTEPQGGKAALDPIEADIPQTLMILALACAKAFPDFLPPLYLVVPLYANDLSYLRILYQCLFGIFSVQLGFMGYF